MAQLATARDLAEANARAEAAIEYELHMRRCRRYAEHFIEYALRHERTGKVIKNQPFHVQWQKTLREHDMAVIKAPVEHGKTVQVAVGKPLHIIGNEPESRGAIISNTATQAVKVGSSIRQHIEANPRVRDVFPDLEPGDQWTTNAFTVKRSTIAKDPTVQCLGVGGPLVGSRLDWAILDDVLTFDNTRTPEQMQKLLEWFDSTLFTRITEGGKVWFIGTPWNPQDLLHQLAARPDWHLEEFCAVHNPDDKPADWVPTWFDKERLLTIYRNTLPYNFNRKYLCRVRRDDLARFAEEWIQRCIALGRGWRMLDRAPRSPSGRLYPCFTGIDLGIGQDEHHDETILFTLAVDERGRRIPMEIQSGRWQGPEIIRRIADAQRRYNSIATVETNAAQEFLMQWGHASGLSIQSHKTTSRNKFDEAFGVESLAIEFRSGLWLIPQMENGQLDPEIDKWLNECRFYEPSGHTGDRLMAAWIAREASRRAMADVKGYVDTLRR